MQLPAQHQGSAHSAYVCSCTMSGDEICVSAKGQYVSKPLSKRCAVVLFMLPTNETKAKSERGREGR